MIDAMVGTMVDAVGVAVVAAMVENGWYNG